MRALLAALILLGVYTGAIAAESAEPFGAPFYTHSDDWAYKLQIRFAFKDKEVVASIVAQVRQKPQEQWLTWANQLANLSGVGDCAPVAVLKVEVLRQLGYSQEDLRLVYGTDSSGEHAVAAVRTPQGWRVLDNGHLAAGYKPLLDSQIPRSFKAQRSFN